MLVISLVNHGYIHADSSQTAGFPMAPAAIESAVKTCSGNAI